jgi:P4 family phage/plasmid primase-like protien
MASRGAKGGGGMEDFFARFQIDGGRCPTHTRFGGSFGSYYIPVVENDRFFKVYARHVARHRFSQAYNGKASACVVERHRDHGPVVIDLDFRFAPFTDNHNRQFEPIRRYNREHIVQFLRKYVNVLAEWVEMPSLFHVVVLEKPSPKMEKGVVKDGVHVVIPEIVTHTRVQTLIRREFLTRYHNQVFEGMNATNSIQDIFDESVIQRNGWMMYGSGKDGDACYEPTFMWKVGKGFCDFNIATVECEPPKSEDDVLRLVRWLSVRNKDDTTPLRPEREPTVEQAIRVEELARAEIRRNPHMQDAEASGARRHATTDDYEMARRLCPLLDAERADDYTSWIKTGLCLHNIDDRLLIEWVAFSQQSAKFEQGMCENLWSHMAHREDGLGLGSLRQWAKQDNPHVYDNIVKECVSGRVQAAISGLHHDVAMVAKGLYFDRFVCSSVKNNSWFHFDHHKWKLCDSGYLLRRLLSLDIFNRFMDEAMVCNRQAQQISASSIGDENSDAKVRHAQLTETYKKLNEVGMKLKNTSFKDAVMRECRELFYKENFESNLDGKPGLIGFDNGVYDLDSHEFRDGSPEDMISYSTGYSFTPYDPGHESVRALHAYFAQVQPDVAVREYLLRLLGSYLHGSIREERFHVWSGSGANSKSICIDLFERALGDYGVKLPVALLTQKRAASNAATSEIARLKGRRFACLQEPSTDETLNTGLLKELTGGDRIMARPLYREPIEFKSFARLALICNALPNVPSTDGGTWRRIRLLLFPSKFCRDPDPNDPLQFPMDLALADKLDDWAPHLMGLLIEKFKTYCAEGNTEPEPVMRCTREYQESQDAVQLFLSHKTIRDHHGAVLAADLHSMYKDFLREMSIAGVSARRAEFVKEVERHLGAKASGTGGNQRFRGIAFRSDEPSGPADDDS